MSSRLLAINGLSLGFALISNFSLLLNMARRLSFSIAQPITIVGWYLSSFLLVADISSIVHIVKVPDERRALTQAYYYAINAAALYFVIASLMVFTVYGAWKGHYRKEFNLTTSQRTLMLQTISFMIWMIGGAGVYASIEGWQFLDSVYFTNYTLLTIGIGDYAPNTHLGRSLLFPYAIVGVIILGLLVGSIRSLVLDRGKKKMGRRQMEKMRERMLKALKSRGETEKITPIKSDAQAAHVGFTEYQRRREEFELMRTIQNQAETRHKWTSLTISAGAWLFLWLVGALIFYFCEHEQQWSYFGSVYFSYTTLLTIGFGDYKPFSNSGKPFFVFWSLLAVPTLTILISNMGDTVVKAIRDATLYLGEATLLPGEEGTVRARVKGVAAKASQGKLTAGDEMDAPPGLASSHNKGTKQQDAEDQNLAMSRGADLLAAEVETDELQKAKSAERRGDKLGENIHEYYYLIAREFRNVMRHVNESPPRKYTYEEWSWFLRLMGEDEGRAESHRAPLVEARKAPNVNVSDDEGIKENAEAVGEGDGGGKPAIQDPQTNDASSGREWSWLGNRSPLMGEMEEAEWVLQRLSVTLEKALKKHSESVSSQGGVDGGGGGGGGGAGGQESGVVASPPANGGFQREKGGNGSENGK